MIKTRTQAEAKAERSKMLSENAEAIYNVWAKAPAASMRDRIVLVEQRRDDGPQVTSASAKKLIHRHKMDQPLVDALMVLRPSELFVVVLGWGGSDGGYVEARQGVLEFKR